MEPSGPCARTQRPQPRPAVRRRRHSWSAAVLGDRFLSAAVIMGNFLSATQKLKPKHHREGSNRSCCTRRAGTALGAEAWGLGWREDENLGRSVPQPLGVQGSEIRGIGDRSLCVPRYGPIQELGGPAALAEPLGQAPASGLRGRKPKGRPCRTAAQGAGFFCGSRRPPSTLLEGTSEPHGSWDHCGTGRPFWYELLPCRTELCRPFLLTSDPQFSHKHGASFFG